MSGGRGAIAVLLALAALLIVAVPASSAHELRIQTTINPSGRTGSLSVASPPGSIGWEACTAKLTDCEPFGRGFSIETNGAPAGTVFRVRNTEGESGISPEWAGPLKELAPPRVAGEIQANGYVTPIPGLWSGGWRAEPAEMQLSACESEAGEGCVSLTNPHYVRRCPWDASFYLEPRFAGWFLRVADRQNGGPHVEPPYGLTTPYGAEVFGQSRTTSVAIAGQIAPAVSPAAGECGPPPAPVATISSEGIARLECGGGCSAALVATRQGRRRSISRELHEENLLRPRAAVELHLTPSQLASLGVGKIRLVVEIDGARVAQRTIRTS